LFNFVFFQLPCGHKCRVNCHPGDCPDAGVCRKKVKVTCPCGRIKQEETCHKNQLGYRVQCDSVCLEEENRKKIEKILEQERKEAEKNRLQQEELEKFEKKLLGKKKVRDRKRLHSEEEVGIMVRYRLVAGAFAVAFLGFLLFYLLI